MIGTKILLSYGEQLVARSHAAARHANNRSEGVKNSKRGPQSDADTDLEGIGGEMAFCKLFNIWPDMSVEPRSSAEDAGDAVLNGNLIDVKCSKYLRGKLIAVPWKTCKVDYYALLVGTFPSYEFRGFMHRDEFLREGRLGNLGYGPTYIADQNELIAAVPAKEQKWNTFEFALTTMTQESSIPKTK